MRNKINGLGFPIQSDDWEIKAEYRTFLLLDGIDGALKSAGLKISYREKNKKRQWGSFSVNLQGHEFPDEEYIIGLVEHAVQMRIGKYGTPFPKKKRLKRELSAA